MTQHLSEEQKSRWLAGQGRLQESEHVRACPLCAADLSAYSGAVSTFRDAMKQWSEQEGSWKIEDVPDFSSWKPHAHSRELRWILTAAAAGLLLIPAFWRLDNTQREEPAPSPALAPYQNADELLMEAVSAHLARPVSAPMERVIALLPSQGPSVKDVAEREDVR